MKSLYEYLKESLCVYVDESVDLTKDITFSKDYIWFNLTNLRLSSQHGGEYRKIYVDVLKNCDDLKQGDSIIIPAGTKCKFLKKDKEKYIYQVPKIKSPLLELTDSDISYIEGYSFEKVSTDNITLVDLGLPSKLKWADMNVGAKKPEEWGELFFTTDAVDGYRKNLPTVAQVKELVDNCTAELEKISGQNVLIITGPNGNSITFPTDQYTSDYYGTLFCSKDATKPAGFSLNDRYDKDGPMAKFRFTLDWTKSTVGRAFRKPIRLVGRKNL